MSRTAQGRRFAALPAIMGSASSPERREGIRLNMPKPKRQASTKAAAKHRAPAPLTEAGIRAKVKAEERQRCEAVFASPEANGRASAAAYFLASTNMAPSSIIRMLDRIPRTDAARAEWRQSLANIEFSKPGAAKPKAENSNHGWATVHKQVAIETGRAPRRSASERIDPNENHGWAKIHADLNAERKRNHA